MRLIFEKGVPDRHCRLLPDHDVPVYEVGISGERRLNPPGLSEDEISRHYAGPTGRAHDVNDDFYPLGSCTMRHSPKVDEETTSLKGSADVHPLQPEHMIQGILGVLGLTRKYLYGITGMKAMTFQPATGVRGEFTDLLLMRAYHHLKGDEKRTKIIIPNSVHGINPASAAMAGCGVASIPSRENGYVGLDKLREAVERNTAGLMLTNPGTIGLFGRNILEVTRIVHEAGRLCHYDGANLSAVMDIVKLGDIGFDVIHLNFHKTFSAPHGGSGPGNDLVGCKRFLRPFLPGFMVEVSGEEEGCRALSLVRGPGSTGRIKIFYGNFEVVVEALSYIMTLGRGGIPEASSNAVLGANYMMNKLLGLYKIAYNGACMHEFVIMLEDLEHGVSVPAVDIAKALLNYGVHPPTMYFPLIVHEALMVEPIETESRETLNRTIEVFRSTYEAVKADPESLHQVPVKATVYRLDEVTVARRPVLCYMGE